MKQIATLFLGAAFLLPTFAAAPPAEAQTKSNSVAKNLDLGLLQRAPKVMLFLANKDYKSVGVLPFQVQKGGRDAAYDAAPLAATLPGRLENALIMTMSPDEQKALKVIRDAASHASKSKVGAWSKDKKAFAKLFDTSYPVAWGNETVKPDIFLTGVITNTGDRATTTVKVMGFTKDDWADDGIKMFEVAKLSVRTDRALLRDLGYNYVLNTAVAKRGVSAEDRDREAVEKVTESESGTLTEDNAVKPIDIGGVRFDILYDNKPQTIRALSEGGAAGAKSPLYQIDPVKPGTEVKVAMTRLSGDGPRLGVIIKLNGLSLFQMDDRDAMQCRKWLLEPEDKGKRYTLNGFWMDSQGKDVRQFRVLTAEQSAQKSPDLGDRAGWIDIDVFSVGEEPQPEEQLMVSTRGQSRQAKKPATLKELHKNLLAANNVRLKETKPTIATRGLIIADLEPTPGVQLQVQERLKNPVRLGGISVKYYDRSKD